MQVAALLVSAFSLLGMAGLFLAESVTTLLGTKQKIKTGLVALFYAALAGLILYGLMIVD